jgi:hypothetical protein
MSPVFIWPESSPLLSPAERSAYHPQVVLVFQLDENMPESIQNLYDQIKGSTRRQFLTPSQLELIPWHILHQLSSFVAASVFAAPGIGDKYDFKKAKKHLLASSVAHTSFGRAGGRTTLGSGASMGARADQRGHAG